ncbi:hypothetical protein BAE44_0017843 [Dichanthelium oligosanthes]|uniref:Pectinesterase catalytic domain-containing protein n=1 Tax=Dichanthelium oligosanthes TaxID=888268 RepID=A0A1E5V7P4_9POAL|nr:hypothetical protein BAE44_0017843 [Dichanthelium oligosanthes]
MSAFYECRFNRYQDTLYTHTSRQYYRDCVITSTINFIFGNAQVVLQNCLIQVHRCMDNQQNIMMGRTALQKEQKDNHHKHSYQATLT